MSIEVDRNRSQSTGVVRFNVRVIRHIISLCFLSFTLRVHFVYKLMFCKLTPAYSGKRQTSPDDFLRLYRQLQTTTDNYRQLQTTTDDYRRLQTTKGDSRLLQTTPDDSRLLRIMLCRPIFYGRFRNY